MNVNNSDLPHCRVELMLNGGACTDDAIAFVDLEEGYEPIWIPRSLIRNLADMLDSLDEAIGWTTNDKVEIEIPTWVVESKGLDSIAEEINDG